MPPVTKTSLGCRVDPVQQLTLAEAISLSMPEEALQRWRLSCLTRNCPRKGEKETRAKYSQKIDPDFVENFISFLEFISHKNTSNTNIGALVF